MRRKSLKGFIVQSNKVYKRTMEAHNYIYERKEQTLVYASFPDINDLCCAICEIDFIEVQASTKSNFHWQTMKCRLLIHLISDIIASPVSGTENYIFIIAFKKFVEIGKLERILKNFKLVYQGLRSVTPELYKSCLKYTIQTKIAPLWNKVDDYYIHGKEFYNVVGGSEALSLDILIDDTNMSLQLHAKKIIVPCIKLEDYLPSSVISQFLADPKGYINLSQYDFPLVYVLPSTKRGKLLSVSKEIPVGSTFKDYNELRRHWKNMYGYSLPKNSDSILYYEIKFLIAKSKIFTYPNLCVASGPLDVMSIKDKESTITHFLSDMFIRLPTICGKQLQISKHNPFTTKCSSNNTLMSTLPKDKGLSTHLKEIDNLNMQLEFSTTYTDECTKSTSATSKTLKTQLAKIHEIHNVQRCENSKIDSENKNITQNRNGTEQSATTEYNKVLSEVNNISKKSKASATITKSEMISKYFKNQKPYSCITKEEGKERNDLTLKEKLSVTKCDGNYSVPLQEVNQNINVEAMARSNQLYQVKNSDLSDWLKKHSIPHNSKGKKVELINKVLSHIKNTQVLQQFRM